MEEGRTLTTDHVDWPEYFAEIGREQIEWTNDDWATPFTLVRELEVEFGPFELDPCCTPETAKAPLFYTKADDGLTKRWAPLRVFCNPPYSAKIAFIEKAIGESSLGALVVCVLPANTKDWWFHDLVWGRAEVRFLRDIRFHAIGREAKTRPRPGFMVAVYRPSTQ